MRLNLEGTLDMNKKLILFMTSLSLAVSPMSVLASEYTGPKASIDAVEDRATLKAATGEYIECVGHYRPTCDPVELTIDVEKAKAWIAKGVQNKTVRRFLLKK